MTRPHEMSPEEKAFWVRFDKIAGRTKSSYRGEVQVAEKKKNDLLASNPYGYVPAWIEAKFPGTTQTYYDIRNGVKPTKPSPAPRKKAEKRKPVESKQGPRPKVQLFKNEKVNKLVRVLSLAGALGIGLTRDQMKDMVGYNSDNSVRWALGDQVAQRYNLVRWVVGKKSYYHIAPEPTLRQLPPPES